MDGANVAVSAGFVNSLNEWAPLEEGSVGSVILTALCCAITGLSLQVAPPAVEPSHEVTLGYTYVAYRSFLRSSPDTDLAELAYRQPLSNEGFGSHVLLGAGLRSGIPDEFSGVTVPLEGFVQAKLRARWAFGR